MCFAVLSCTGPFTSISVAIGLGHHCYVCKFRFIMTVRLFSFCISAISTETTESRERPAVAVGALAAAVRAPAAKVSSSGT